MSNLVEIGAKLASYLTSLSPQIKDGSLQYYLSGSLATMVMASAESIAEIELDESNNLIGETDSKSITEEQKERLGKFSRKLGLDIDVVNVNGDLYRGSPVDNKPHAQNVIQHVPEVLELMSWGPDMAGTMYIDGLELERKISSHPVARVKTQSGDIYVTAPPEQLAHKLSETIWLTNRLAGGKFYDSEKDKYEKDIRDLSLMFYGFKDLYGKDEFLNRIYLALNEKDGALFSIHNPMFNRENAMKAQEIFEKYIIRRIIEDSSNYLGNITDDKSKVEISEFFSNLIDRRRLEVENLIKSHHANNKLTPLQQREAELSKQEAEARYYDEAESLKDKLEQKEGQDVGEE